MRARSRGAARKGLSLLEVILSLLIFLLAIGAISHLLTSSSHMAVESRTRIQAALYAHSKLNEVRVGALPMSGQQEGPLDDDQDYNWSMDVSPSALEGLYNVTVHVSRPAPTGGVTKVSLTQIILDPQFQGSSLDGVGSNSQSESESSSSSSSSSSGTGSTGGTASGGSSGSKSGSGASGGMAGKSGGTGGMSGTGGGSSAGRLGGSGGTGIGGGKP
jgi:type II secretory pathway pseudopilin PulG